MVSICTWGHGGHAEHSHRRDDQQARQVEDVQNQSSGFRDGALVTEKKCKRNFVLWRSCLHLISTTSRGACESHQPQVDFEAQSDALSFTFPPCVGSEVAISATHHGQTPLHVQGCQDEHA